MLFVYLPTVSPQVPEPSNNVTTFGSSVVPDTCCT